MANITTVDATISAENKLNFRKRFQPIVSIYFKQTLCSWYRPRDECKFHIFFGLGNWQMLLS